MLDGVTISESKAQKDELILEGNDVQNVSQSGTLSSHLYLSALLTPPKRLRSRVSAVYGTRISVNSWMVSTYRRRRLLHRSNLIDALFPFPSSLLAVVPRCTLFTQKSACRMSLPLCFRYMTTTMSALHHS